MHNFYRISRLTLLAVICFTLSSTLKAQVILTVAGNGSSGYTGDGAAATAASVSSPNGVAVDKQGNVYIADYNNQAIRKVDAFGNITTLAGGAGPGYADGVGTAAAFDNPQGIAVDTNGNVYVADSYNQRIRMVSPAGVVTTIAGSGGVGFSGDGGPASGASLNYPSGVAVDKFGNIFIADNGNQVIREITGSTINTVAGNNALGAGFSGDGGPATNAQLYYPNDVAVDNSGNMFIADRYNQVIRKVTGGNISTFAGSPGNAGNTGSGLPATAAWLNYPYSVAVDASGNVYITDANNSMLRKVGINDTLTTMAGLGSGYYNGDNQEATNAALNNPLYITVNDSGNIYFSDNGNQRVRKISMTGPNITVQPQSNQNICPNSPAYVSIGVTGTGITYQWLVDTNYMSWDTIKNGAVYSGANSDTLKFNIGSQQGSTYQYMCVINGGYITSSVGYVYVNYLPNLKVTSPADSVCPGVATHLSATITGGSIIKPTHVLVSSTGILWSTGDTLDTITVRPLVTTTYEVTATQGCSITDTITVMVDRDKVSVKAFPSSSVCAGNTVTLFGQGVSSYSWSGGVNNGVGFSPPATTTYTVTGVDVMGCILKDSITVTVNPLPAVTITTSTTTDTVCAGTAETLTGGGAVSYNWSGGITNGVPFTPVSSQVYYLTGTDANGCSATKSIPITVTPLPIITGTASPASVCGGNSVTLTGNGGTSYSWSGGVTNGVSFVPATSGTYTVTGTNASGCANSGQVTVTVSPKPVIVANAFPSATLCQGSSVALFGSGGVSYAWTGGVNNGVSFNPVKSGTYTVTGIDVNGCSNTDSINVTVNNKVVITPITSNTMCGLNNGTASVLGSNGVPPYTYSWSTTPASTNSSVDSLAPGTYVVTVNDATNCPSTLAISIGASTAPILSVTTSPSNCGTIGTGSASVSVTGGTAPYKYMWNNGDTLTNDYNLKAATYIITVTDVNGCSTFAPAIVTNANGPKITVASQTNVKCHGDLSGAIDVTVSGGVAPYMYMWSTGATTSSISSLAAGPYQLTVMDADSCTSVMSFTITQPNALSIVSSITKADCGVADGSVTAAVTGGTSPFTYSWNNGATTSNNSSVMAGVYSVMVMDGNGCMDSASIAVSDKTGPSVSLNVTANAGCGSGGAIIANATGGTSPYTYMWSDGSTSTSISNVPAGNYFVTVTDNLGCVGTADTSIIENVPAVLPICMVTVDSTSTHNMVVWDKSASTNIDHYNVYKESTMAGVYFLVASVPYTSPATYVDSLSNPMVRSWRYKISQVDTCGNESPLSPNHKTMHLTVNEGVGNVINLIWDNYEGLAFSTYYVYRDTIPFHYTLIDSIPNNIITYTDLHPLHTITPAIYHIGIDNPGSCTPLRTEAINYNSSKSNSGNIIFVPTGIANVSDLNGCSIFPNPSNGKVTVSMNLSQNTQDLSLIVINELGQDVYTQSYSKLGGPFSTQLDLSDLAKGVYMIKLTSNQGSVYKKLVLQ